LTLGRGKMSTLPTVFGLINRFDPKGLRVVIFAAFLGAIFDMAGVASVTPFLSIISNPGLIQENYYLSGLYEWFSFSETRDFIIFIGCATILFLVVVAVIRALIATRITLFIHWQRHNISFELFRNGFYAPLAIDGNEHSSLLTSRVFGETDVFIDSAVRPLIELMVHGLLLLMLLVMLLAVDLWNTLAILTGLAVFFGLIVIATRGPILRSGENRSRANVERYRSLKEALAGALELRLLGREDIYIARFFHASKMFARSVATNQAILQVATYAVQAFTFAGIIALTIGLIGQLLDRQAIQLAPDHDRRPVCRAIIDRSHTMTAKPGQQAIRRIRAQIGGDIGGGLFLCPRHLRDLVQSVAQPGQLRQTVRRHARPSLLLRASRRRAKSSPAW